jgi:hypothetical protein
MDFRIFEGECPSFPGRTMVSASESLFSPLSSREPFLGAAPIVMSGRKNGGEDVSPFGVPVAALLTAGGSEPCAVGEEIDFAAIASSGGRASISFSPCAALLWSSSWATLLRDTLAVFGWKDQEDHPSPIAERLVSINGDLYGLDDGI